MSTAVLRSLLARPISFHPALARLTGSVQAGLMLSQAVYWSEKKDGEWFYKTQQQWSAETALSRHEVEHARLVLRGFSFWKEERRGMPATVHFRVDLDALFAALEIAENQKSSLPESGKQDRRKAAILL